MEKRIHHIQTEFELPSKLKTEAERLLHEIAIAMSLTDIKALEQEVSLLENNPNLFLRSSMRLENLLPTIQKDEPTARQLLLLANCLVQQENHALAVLVLWLLQERYSVEDTDIDDFSEFVKTLLEAIAGVYKKIPSGSCWSLLIVQPWLIQLTHNEIYNADVLSALLVCVYAASRYTSSAALAHKYDLTHGPLMKCPVILRIGNCVLTGKPWLLVKANIEADRREKQSDVEKLLRLEVCFQDVLKKAPPYRDALRGRILPILIEIWSDYLAAPLQDVKTLEDIIDDCSKELSTRIVSVCENDTKNGGFFRDRISHDIQNVFDAMFAHACIRNLSVDAEHIQMFELLAEIDTLQRKESFFNRTYATA